MQRLRRFIALLLLALWLPATLHCGIEAAGFAFGTACCADSGSHHSTAGQGDCETDGCNIVEGGFTRPLPFQLFAPTPLFSVPLAYALSLPPTLAPLSPPVSGVSEAMAAPPEINGSWIFVTRAALSPRAPSIAS